MLMSNGRNRARYLESLSDSVLESGELVDGSWRSGRQLSSFDGQGLTESSTQDARQIRDRFADYFSGEEALIDLQNLNLEQDESEGNERVQS